MDMLARAPDRRFQSIDAKLSHALRKVIDNAGDKPMQVKYDMSMKNQMYKKSGDFIKSRELFAMILASFNSPDHTEVLHNSHHMYVFNYYGDDQLEAFTTNGSTLCITWSKMIVLLWTLCVTHCSARLNIRSSCILTSAGTGLSMKGIQKRPMNSWSTWSKVTSPVGNKNDC